MDSVEYKVFLDMNTAVQKIVFAIYLSKNGQTSESVDKVSRDYDFASDLLDLQVICILLRELDKYDTNWATEEKKKIKDMGKQLVKQSNGIMERLDIMSVEKEMSEDVDYVLGNRTFPNIRNMKRFNAFKMILEGKSYNEIISSFSN